MAPIMQSIDHMDDHSELWIIGTVVSILTTISIVLAVFYCACCEKNDEKKQEPKEEPKEESKKVLKKESPEEDVAILEESSETASRKEPVKKSKKSEKDDAKKSIKEPKIDQPRPNLVAAPVKTMNAVSKAKTVLRSVTPPMAKVTAKSAIKESPKPFVVAKTVRAPLPPRQKPKEKLVQPGSVAQKSIQQPPKLPTPMPAEKGSVIGKLPSPPGVISARPSVATASEHETKLAPGSFIFSVKVQPVHTPKLGPKNFESRRLA